MSVSRVYVNDLGELASALSRLADEWDSVMERAMREALLRTGYFGEVWRRTPKSDRGRYASQYRNVTLRITSKGSQDDPSTWKASLRSNWESMMMRGVEGTTAIDRRQRSIDRINEYGMKRLANSILPKGASDESLQVRRRAGAIELVLSSSVPYAARMHEAVKPAEGEYWTPGKRTGWSAARTGNRYLDKPYEDLQDKILRQLGLRIDAELRRRGLA